MRIGAGGGGEGGRETRVEGEERAVASRDSKGGYDSRRGFM